MLARTRRRVTWSPPPAGASPHRPEFGELTHVVRGRLRVDVEGDRIDVAARQSIWVEPGRRVRYSNPFGGECEYYAVCVPAFSPERAHREE